MWKQTKPAFSEIVFAVTLLILLSQLGIALLDYAGLTQAALAFPFPLEYGEGPVLDQTVRLVHLETIYRNDFARPPYTVSNDPPLFQLIQVPFAWIAGPAFWYGRLISILSAVAAAALVGLILITLTGDRIASSIGGLMLLLFPFITQASVSNRGDMLAFALGLGGLLVVVRWPDRQRGLWAAGLLFTAANFTSLSAGLAAPLAAFVWLLSAGQRRRAFGLAVLVAGSCVGLFVLLNLLTQGGLYLNVVRANLNPFSWYAVTGHVIDLYLHAGYLVIGCITFIIVDRLGETTRSWKLLAPFVSGAVLTAPAVGIAGSSPGYLFGTVAALCLAGGALLAWSGDNYWLKALIAAVLAAQAHELVNWSRQEYTPLVWEKVANYREVAQLAELVRDAPGPVLADEYMGLMPLSGRRLYFQPFEYKQLQEANLWSGAALVASIQSQEFSTILLYEPLRWNAIPTRWTPELRNAIYEHYTLEKTLADTFVYLPTADDR